MKYRVTDIAPPNVAGRRVAAGDVLDLTEPQARHELLVGHIEEVVEPAPSKPVQSPSKPASKD